MDNLICLINKVRNGDDIAFEKLCNQYKPLIDSMSYKFSVSCKAVDIEDFKQEAKMAFYKAILAFETEQNVVTFGLFVKTCIQNRLISCVRKANSKKRHQIDETDSYQPIDIAPPDSVLQSEFKKSSISLAKSILSKFELQVFEMYYFDCIKAKEISSRIGRSEKSINNAINRIKAKLKRRKKENT